MQAPAVAQGDFGQISVGLRATTQSIQRGSREPSVRSGYDPSAGLSLVAASPFLRGQGSLELSVSRYAAKTTSAPDFINILTALTWGPRVRVATVALYPFVGLGNYQMWFSETFGQSAETGLSNESELLGVAGASLVINVSRQWQIGAMADWTHVFTARAFGVRRFGVSLLRTWETPATLKRWLRE